MSIALRIRAVRAYGDLLRVQRNLFGEDIASRLKALAHTRLKFRENEKVADPKKIEELVHQAEQAKVYLEQNVVQGVKNQSGPFKLHITEKNTQDYRPNS
jgi:hypothetical protein